jgi:xylulokinase
MDNREEFFIGVDSGTQSTKAILINGNNGRVISKAIQMHKFIDGLSPGNIEQNPSTWVDAMSATIRDVVSLLGSSKHHVRGIGVSAQQHGFVPLDKNGKVIRPAKLWNDTSTAEESSYLIKELGGTERVIGLIGNSIPPGFTASKILWLKNHELDNYSRLAHVLLPHNYLNFILTGKFSMEYGDASGTALMDVVKRQWSQEVIDVIDPHLQEMLPDLRPSDEPLGFIRETMAKELGLPEDTLISSGGGDNMMGAIGTGNTSQGKVTVSLGTSGTIYAYSSKPIIDPLGEVAAFCDSTNGWLPLVCTMNVAVATEAVRSLLGLSHFELEDAMIKISPGCDGLLFLPYLTGERIPNLPLGKGVYYGLTTRNFTRDYLTRSTVEGVTMGLNYGLNRMKELGIRPTEIMVTGGAASNKAWRQIAADVFNTEVVALEEEEGAAYGAALQAMWCYNRKKGESLGISDITDKYVRLNESSRSKPLPKNVEIYERLQDLHDELSLRLRTCKRLMDLQQQKKIRNKEEMFKHLESTALKPRYSAGVWYFYPGASRFHETYLDKGSIEDVLNKIAWMYDEGYIDSDFGVEAHYPNEINFDNLHLYKNLERETGIKLVTVIPFLFYDRRYQYGSLSNPDNDVRKHALDRTVMSLKLNKEANTEFAVIWPGIDGYENPFGNDFYGMWNRFENALSEAMDQVPEVRVAMEPKPYEPRGNNIWRNTANGLLMARDVEKLLMAQKNRRILDEGKVLIGLNPEVGHVLMGHEELAYAFASIMREGRLMHSHWNSQPLGNYDQDLNIGVLGYDQMLAALLVLKMYDYKGFYGIDINPERMPVERALVLSMNSMDVACAILNRLDNEILVDTMFNPIEKQGLVEDILTRAIASKDLRVRPLP